MRHGMDFRGCFLFMVCLAFELHLLPTLGSLDPYFFEYFINSISFFFFGILITYVLDLLLDNIPQIPEGFFFFFYFTFSVVQIG